MKHYFPLFFMLLMTISCVWARPLPKHWHETNGYGTKTKGGLAGEVYKVTNLNASGKGSLKDAVSKGNRLVVFEVGGVIKGGLGVPDNTTIAGQTAPYPGITCIGGLQVGGKDKVISHLSFQYTGGADACNLGGTNVVLDHVVVYWGRDETITTGGDNGVTMYKTINAEGLQFTGHGDGEHSKGMFLRDPKQLSLIGCMVVNNALRNPRVNGGKCFIANHLVYNHGPGWDHQGPKLSSDDELPGCDHCFTKIITGRRASVTLVGSIALAGPESSPKARYLLDGHNSTVTAYMKDNIVKDREGNDLEMANTEGVFTGGASGPEGAVTLVESPTEWPEGFEPLPAHEALYEVLRTVGPHPGARNKHSKRLVNDVAKGTGKIIDDPEEVGGYADYPPSQPRPLTVPDGEKARQTWLDSLEDEIAVDTTLDLSRLYKMVGSRASDKLLPASSLVNKDAGNPKSGFKIRLSQINSRIKRLRVVLTLSGAQSVGMRVYDLAGNLVGRQVPEYYNAGKSEFYLNVQNLPAGLYICRFRVGHILSSQTYYCY